jgi:hypothetical protein
MGDLETELEMVRRHIREGSGRVASQEALVARLCKNGQSVSRAQEMLQIFRYLQKEHEAHLDRLNIRAKLDSTSR